MAVRAHQHEWRLAYLPRPVSGLRLIFCDGCHVFWRVWVN